MKVLIIGRILIASGGVVVVLFIFNFLIMSSVHFCFHRINPALAIDLCKIGTFENGEFLPLPDDRLSVLKSYLNSVGLCDFISCSDICRDAYVMHGSVCKLLTAIPVERVDWFQDTLIVVSPVNLDTYESPEKEG